MAGRYPKLGLDYFPLPVGYSRELPILKLSAAAGWKGYLVLLEVLDYIYGNRGYYCEWTEDAIENVAMRAEWLPQRLKERISFISTVVSTCLNLGIFNKSSYESGNILTSLDIQHTWLIATRKRTKRYVVKDYWIYTASQAEELQFTAEEIAQSKGNKIFFINKSDIGAIEEAIRDHESVANDSRRKKGSESGSENEHEDTGDYKISYEQFLQKKRYEGQSFTDRVRCSSVRYYDAPATEIWKMFTIFCNKQITCEAKPDEENKLLEHFFHWLEKVRLPTLKPKNNEKPKPTQNSSPRVGRVANQPENNADFEYRDIL